MSERFNVDVKWSLTDTEDNDIDGYFIVDNLNDDELYMYVDDKPLLFRDREHAEIFCRLMNFGQDLHV